MPRRSGGRAVLHLPFFPDFLLRELVGWLLALGLLGLLAALFPWELGSKADPLSPAPAEIRPEWYFLFMFQALKLFPTYVAGIPGELVGVLAIVVVALLWLLVPLLDRRAARDRPSPLLTAAGVVALAGMLALTVMALR